MKLERLFGTTANVKGADFKLNQEIEQVKDQLHFTLALSVVFGGATLGSLTLFINSIANIDNGVTIGTGAMIVMAGGVGAFSALAAMKENIKLRKLESKITELNPYSGITDDVSADPWTNSWQENIKKI